MHTTNIILSYVFRTGVAKFSRYLVSRGHRNTRGQL